MSPSSKTYHCNECGTHVGRKSDLDRHMRLHATNREELKHPCPYPGCTYKALQSSNLKTHLNTHTGERPHKCPHEGCDFDTRDPGSLTKHRQRKHGYDPKANSGKKSSTSARRTRQSRFSPYSTSSRPSRSSTASAVSEAPSSSSSEHQVPPPQFPQPIDACSPSSVLVVDERAQELKNNTVAFETELALQFARANGSRSETILPPSPSLPCAVPFTEPEVPTGELAQLMSLLEQQNLHTFGQPDELVSRPTPQSDADAEFERFLAQYDDFLAKASSAHDATFQSNPYATGNSPISTAFPASTLNTIDDPLVSATLFLPPSNTQQKQCQYDVVSNTADQCYENHDYFSRPMSFAQSDSFARAPTYMDVYPQTVASELFNPAYSYTVPADPSAFLPVQNLYMF